MERRRFSVVPLAGLLGVIVVALGSLWNVSGVVGVFELYRSGGGETAATVSFLAQNQIAKLEERIARLEKGIAKSRNNVNTTQTSTTTTNDDGVAATSFPKRNVKDFERQPGVVVATKIHGPEYLTALKQMYCLFSAAYNWNMQYDIVLFATEDISQEDRTELAEIVHPANLTIYIDEKTLHDHIAEMDENQTSYLLRRCRVNSVKELTWRHHCWEAGQPDMPLAYTWQCEFRSKWLWRHPGLAQYKYMLWLDSDSMCSKPWEQDPVAAMVRNDLVLLADNFPQGSAKGWQIQDRIQKTFNKTLCGISVVDGHFEPQYGDCWKDTNIWDVHGFFHITSLDFFRSPPVLQWADNLIGDSKFSRRFDDQVAVTVPPAVLAPNRSWDMWANGINLTVFHNGMLDGKLKWRGGFFLNYWRRMGQAVFPEAYERCGHLVKDKGRRF